MLPNTRKQDYKDLYTFIRAMKQSASDAQAVALGRMEGLVEVMHTDLRAALNMATNYEDMLRLYEQRFYGRVLSSRERIVEMQGVGVYTATKEDDEGVH